MKITLLSKSLLFLLIIFGYSSCNIERLDKDLTPEAVNSRQNGCSLIITGNVVSTLDLKGIDEVRLSSTLFTEKVETDENGAFVIRLHFEEGSRLSMVKVSTFKEGYIKNDFLFDLSEVLDSEECILSTNIEWNIGLTPLKPSVGVRPDRPTNITITDTLAVATFEIDAEGNLIETDTILSITKYRVLIPKVIPGQPGVISITPNHNFANGPGLIKDPNDPNNSDQGIGLVTFHFEATQGIQLNGQIRIQFIPALPLDSRDVVNISPNAGFILSFNSNTGVLTLAVTTLTDFTVYNSSAECDTEETAAMDGEIVAQGDYSNCDCGNTELYIQVIPSNLPEQMQIEFPESFSEEQEALILREIRNKLGIGGAGMSSSNNNNVDVLVEKCNNATVPTNGVVRNYSGNIYGSIFIYSVSEETETSIFINDCPVTSNCHQGC